jgi:hypothetical protein
VTSSPSTPSRAPRRKLTPKQRVLKKYPQAFAETCGQQGWQIVSPRPYGYVLVLSRFGRSNRREAWADAARELKVTFPRGVSNA